MLKLKGLRKNLETDEVEEYEFEMEEPPEEEPTTEQTNIT